MSPLVMHPKLSIACEYLERAAEEVESWRNDTKHQPDEVVEGLASSFARRIFVGLQKIVENLTPFGTNATTTKRRSRNPLATIDWNIGTIEADADADAAVQLRLDMKKLANILQAIGLAGRELADHWKEVAAAQPEERSAVKERLLKSANKTVSTETFGLVHLQVLPPTGMPNLS